MENVDHCVWHLAHFGYLVIPFIPSDDIESTRGRFLDTARGFPEYQNVEKQFQFVAGGFSALGNPASFHNPFVREMRQKAYATHRRLFRNSGLNGHALFDRMMLRPAGKSPTKESWHRDVTPGLAVEDTMYGGWVNFDSLPQYFSCVPRSHNDAKDNAVGFAKIKSVAQLRRCKDGKTVVEIPEGHMIIFHQNLIHEVIAKSLDHHQYRLFTPFRTTPGTDVLSCCSLYDAAIFDQGVPKIPSGQRPSVWPHANWNYPLQRPKLEAFSAHFKDVVCYEKQLQTDLTVPPMRIVVQKMDSLRTLDLPMYPDYTDAERAIFVPSVLTTTTLS
jgi:hypothetical protein